MHHPRQNDPLGTSDNPAVTSDPARVAERVVEIERRLAHIAASFRVSQEAIGGVVEFNRSFQRLKRAVDGKAPRGAKLRRLHPLLELAITLHAHSHTMRRTGRADAAMVQADVDAAARTVVSSIRPTRGRPEELMRRHHVEGLMALIQEQTGKPVLASRYKDSVYEPHFPAGVSRLIPRFFQWLDPTISTTTLVNYVRDARRKYAGKPMRFRSYYPLYGGSLDPETGMPAAGPEHRIEQFAFSVPIYCP